MSLSTTRKAFKDITKKRWQKILEPIDRVLADAPADANGNFEIKADVFSSVLLKALDLFHKACKTLQWKELTQAVEKKMTLPLDIAFVCSFAEPELASRIWKNNVPALKDVLHCRSLPTGGNSGDKKLKAIFLKSAGGSFAKAGAAVEAELKRTEGGNQHASRKAALELLRAKVRCIDANSFLTRAVMTSRHKERVTEGLVLEVAALKSQLQKRKVVQAELVGLKVKEPWLKRMKIGEEIDGTHVEKSIEVRRWNPITLPPPQQLPRLKENDRMMLLCNGEIIGSCEYNGFKTYRSPEAFDHDKKKHCITADTAPGSASKQLSYKWHVNKLKSGDKFYGWHLSHFLWHLKPISEGRIFNGVKVPKFKDPCVTWSNQSFAAALEPTTGSRSK